MDKKNSFELLSSTLTNEERKKMLASIRKTMESRSEPILLEQEPDSPILEVHIKALGLFDRIRLFLAQLFTGRTKEDVVQGWILRSLQDRLIKSGIDGIDGRGRQFREAFARDLEVLREKALLLTPLVEIVTGRRTELVLSLAGQYLPGIHRELVRRTAEDTIRSLGEENERILKRELTSTLESLLNDIPANERGGIKRALEQADLLYRLASFSFSGLLNSFEGTGQDTGRHCAFDYVTRNVETLNRILVSLSGPLELILLEQLVLLRAPADADGPPKEETLEERLRTGVEEALAALAAFRTFAGTYPLTLILRITKEDPWWKPRMEQGGEDWIALYRAFFSDRILTSVLAVTLSVQIRKQVGRLKEITGTVPQAVSGLPDGSDGLLSACWFQGMVLKTIVGTIRSQVGPHLRIVLTGGEFYKSSNRAQFNDAYNEFEKFPESVATLEANLRPDGSWGSVLVGPVDASARAVLMRRVDEDISRLAGHAKITIDMLVNVLGGILYAHPGSSYDTLANYGQIGGRRNSEFIEDLRESHLLLQTISAVMGEFETLELRAKENEIILDARALLDRGEQVT